MLFIYMNQTLILILVGKNKTFLVWLKNLICIKKTHTGLANWHDEVTKARTSNCNTVLVVIIKVICKLLKYNFI